MSSRDETRSSKSTLFDRRNSRIGVETSACESKTEEMRIDEKKSIKERIGIGTMYLKLYLYSVLYAVCPTLYSIHSTLTVLYSSSCGTVYSVFVFVCV